MKHPYKELEQHPLWAILNQALDDLVANGDMEEKTARAYIVGYLTKMIVENQEMKKIFFWSKDRNNNKILILPAKETKPHHQEALV